MFVISHTPAFQTSCCIAKIQKIYSKNIRIVQSLEIWHWKIQL